ncbi:SRPBCC family protein [Oceanicola sp. S124]|uniref:SRPBCC family protein n=1 Tax=Oceanicola sp. S124 TaxID=1042378 RepID=UPI000255796D|nr:SRPBCC family protein [Oceanicola sp. S124]
MTDTPAPSPWADATLSREVVIARVVDAAPQLVFDAWTDPAQIVLWFGPAGVELTTHQIDIRPGGLWRFDMVAPDGTVFPNRMRFLRVEAPHLIEIEHGSDRDDDPDRFRMLVTFDAQANGKTVITLRQMHPSPERRAVVIGFGAVEYGAQTLGKLAAHAEERRPAIA